MYAFMIGLHAFVGIGGIAGGLGAVLNPLSPMGIPLSALRNGPFENFLIPGLTLLVVIGLGNLTAALFCVLKWPCHALLSAVMGAIMVGWIVIQCWMLESVVALHVIFFFVGVVQGLFGLALLWRRNEFPLRTLRYWFE